MTQTDVDHVTADTVSKKKQRNTKKQMDASAGENDDAEKYAKQSQLVDNAYSETKKQMNNLLVEIKKLQMVHRVEMKKVKTKKNKRNENYEPTGFARPRSVTGKFAEFIGVQDGTELTGPQITRRMWATLKEKNLTWSEDARVLRTNDEVSALMFVPKSVNESTNCKDIENGFNFCNLQFYIKQGLEGRVLERKKVKSKVEEVKTSVPALKPVEVMQSLAEQQLKNENLTKKQPNKNMKQKEKN